MNNQDTSQSGPSRRYDRLYTSLGPTMAKHGLGLTELMVVSAIIEHEEARLDGGTLRFAERGLTYTGLTGTDERPGLCGWGIGGRTAKRALARLMEAGLVRKVLLNDDSDWIYLAAGEAQELMMAEMADNGTLKTWQGHMTNVISQDPEVAKLWEGKVAPKRAQYLALYREADQLLSKAGRGAECTWTKKVEVEPGVTVKQAMTTKRRIWLPHRVLLATIIDANRLRPTKEDGLWAPHDHPTLANLTGTMQRHPTKEPASGLAQVMDWKSWSRALADLKAIGLVAQPKRAGSIGPAGDALRFVMALADSTAERRGSSLSGSSLLTYALGQREGKEWLYAIHEGVMTQAEVNDKLGDRSPAANPTLWEKSEPPKKKTKKAPEPPSEEESQAETEALVAAETPAEPEELRVPYTDADMPEPANTGEVGQLSALAEQPKKRRRRKKNGRDQGEAPGTASVHNEDK